MGEACGEVCVIAIMYGGLPCMVVSQPLTPPPSLACRAVAVLRQFGGEDGKYTAIGGSLLWDARDHEVNASRTRRTLSRSAPLALPAAAHWCRYAPSPPRRSSPAGLRCAIGDVHQAHADAGAVRLPSALCSSICLSAPSRLLCCPSPDAGVLSELRSHGRAHREVCPVRL